MWRVIICGYIIATFWIWCVISSPVLVQTGNRTWSNNLTKVRQQQQWSATDIDETRPSRSGVVSTRNRRSNRVLCPDKKRECRIIRRPSEPCYVYLNCTVCFWGEPNCTRISEPPSPFCQVADCRMVPTPPTPPTPSPTPTPTPTPPSPTPPSTHTKHVIGIIAAIVLAFLVLGILAYGGRAAYSKFVTWRSNANRRERRRIVEIIRERDEMELMNFRRSMRDYTPIPSYRAEEDPDSIIYHVNQRDREAEERERREEEEAQRERERIRAEEQEPIIKINVSQATARMTRTWSRVKETSHSVRNESSRVARQSAQNVSAKAKSFFRRHE